MKKDGNLIERRPAEVASGIGLAAAVYGFLAEAGVANALAAIVAVIVAFGPLMVSSFVDAARGVK